MADIDFAKTLVHDATDYCRRAGISLARLATLVVNDGKFFERIGAGGGFTTRTYQRFSEYFRNNPPAPDASDRPKRKRAA